MHPCHERKKNNVGKDNLNGPDDGLQINQKRIGKKTWLSWGRWWWDYYQINWMPGTESKIKEK